MKVTRHNKLFVSALFVILLLTACTGGATPTPTIAPATDTPQPTASPTLNPTDQNVSFVDCFGRLQVGFLRVNTNDNPCLRGDAIDYPLGTEDNRYASIYPGFFFWEVAGSQRTLAYINTQESGYEFRNGMYNGMRIELTQINGQFGVQFDQDFRRGVCYLIKQTGRIQMFGGSMNDVWLAGQVFTTDGEQFALPAQAFPSRFSDYEIFWLVETNALRIETVVAIYTEMLWAGYLSGSTNTIHAIEVMEAPQGYCEGGGVVHLE